MSSSETPKCGVCDKIEDLKKCAQCKETNYCSRECQKADWKNHKKICGGKTPPPPPKTTSGSNNNPGFGVFNEMLGLQKNDHLHKLSERDAMIQLIDCFRMRMEDEYTFTGDSHGIYAQESPFPPFRKFLNLAEKRDGILPPWWNKEKRAKVEQMAGNDGWGNINKCVEKSDIQDHYHDSMMPAKLRILGEKIYGKGFM